MAKDTPTLTPDMLLYGYAKGIFPMAEHRDDRDVFWVDPKKRGILPLDGFHMSRSLARTMRRTSWHITVNTDFTAVMEGCADRPDTWINPDIIAAYTHLHGQGFAHSLEIRDADSLVGGIYGVALGSAFFGESMFSRASNASKIALAACVERLIRGGFTLFDTQFLTSHLASLGAIEVPRARFRAMLADALDHSANFETPETASPAAIANRLR